MACKGCLLEELQYEILFALEPAQESMNMIVGHLVRRGFEAEVRGGILSVSESGAKELLDFIRDHLDPGMLSFRIQNQQWQPIEGMENVLHSQWIDEVIKKKAVTCFVQPIVDRNEKVIAYEMLSRFPKEDGTLRYPDQIFSAAKERGRLYALDRLCRMEAVRGAASIHEAKVFINFIPTSIYAPEFCLQSTTQLARRLGVDPSRLVFEVVETEKVEDVGHLKKILAYYKERGFEYALDDVGEGFSTVEMLEDIAPHYMKLDMQYVRGVAADLEKQRAAKLFLKKAKEIGSVPLAEGVEEKEEFEWLREAGYELFQGYFFGRPSPQTA